MGVVLDRVVPRHPRVPLFEPADRLLDLGDIAEPTLGDARVEFTEIGEQSLLMCIADRAILLDPPLAAAEDVRLVADRLPLDEDARLFLTRIAGRRDPNDLVQPAASRNAS